MGDAEIPLLVSESAYGQIDDNQALWHLLPISYDAVKEKIEG